MYSDHLEPIAAVMSETVCKEDCRAHSMQRQLHTLSRVEMVKGLSKNESMEKERKNLTRLSNCRDQAEYEEPGVSSQPFDPPSEEDLRWRSAHCYLIIYKMSLTFV